MNIFKLGSIKHTSKLIILSIALVGTSQTVIAQDDNEERREAMQERRAEFREENPELAAERDAMRVEREGVRAEREAEFREKYPETAALRDERRANGEDGFRGGQGPRGKGRPNSRTEGARGFRQ